jgi:hypothetical protein
VPPAAGPLVGVTELTVGAATYVKQPLHVPLCESGFVTTTFTAAAAWAVVVPVILVALVVEMVSVDPPSETVAPVWKSAPVIVRAVPPRVEPVVGLIDVTFGAATYVKHPEHAPFCVSGFVTVTFTAPAACAAVVPVIVVALIVATVSAEPPNEAVAPAWNPVPLMDTELPPVAGPLFGVTELTVGAATYVKQPVHVPACESGFVTTTFTVPTECAVVVPVMLVALIVETVSADPPNDTVAPVWKPLPLTVTELPPAAGPLFGVTELTAGAAT